MCTHRRQLGNVSGGGHSVVPDKGQLSYLILPGKFFNNFMLRFDSGAF